MLLTNSFDFFVGWDVSLATNRSLMATLDQIWRGDVRGGVFLGVSHAPHPKERITTSPKFLGTS